MADLYFNEEGFTQSEADNTLENARVWKDFWTVSNDKRSNLPYLQAMLDVLYNKEENNRIYVGDMLRSQNSTRLIIKCLVCNKELSSYDPFMGHDNGKLHKKAVQLCLNRDVTNPNTSGALKFRTWNEQNECFTFQDGSLEDKLSRTSHDVLGYQFIFKMGSEEIYCCQLCYHNRTSKRMSKDEAFEHIRGERHILKFLKVKYNRRYDSHDEAIRDRDYNNIIQIEGRITANILETQDISAEEISIKKRRRSPSPMSLKDGLKLCEQQEIQTEKMVETVEMFNAELLYLKNCLSTYEELVNFLKSDSDAYDLIILLLKILSQKFYIYGKNFDPTFLESASKLLEKTNSLKIPPSTFDCELD